jgi:two-component system response regulator FixJ
MAGSRIVYVVDDDDAVRNGVTLLLEITGHEVVAYSSGTAFLGGLSDAAPGCILLDIHMPGITGLEVQGRLRERNLSWPVVVLTGQGDVGIAVQAIRNGAFEFLEKPYQNETLLGVLKEAFEKLEALNEESTRVAEARALIAMLTNREHQVARGLLAGLPNKLIAFELDISIRTVEIDRANVMDKLRARGLSAAVRVALAAGVEPLVERRAS